MKIFPESGLMALKINFAIVDFPEPDCPAIAFKISPCFREKFTASAAITSFESDEKSFFSEIFWSDFQFLVFLPLLVLYSTGIRNLCKTKIVKI